MALVKDNSVNGPLCTRHVAILQPLGRRRTGLLRTAPPRRGGHDEVEAGITPHPFRNSATNRIFGVWNLGRDFREEFPPLPRRVAQEPGVQGFRRTLTWISTKSMVSIVDRDCQKANTCSTRRCVTPQNSIRRNPGEGCDRSFRWEEMQSTLEINVPPLSHVYLSAAEHG